MTRAFPIKAALILTAGLLTNGCGKVDCTLAENMSKDECKPATVDYAAVFTEMKNGGCTLSACHGGSTPAMGGKLVGITAANKASCTTITSSANALVSTSSPATSKLATYAYNAGHGGGNMLTGWKSASDPGPTAVVNWLKGGGACPTQ